MVPCLHQGNIYIKRKLRVWRDKKCIRIVGAKNPRICTGSQTILSQGSRFKAENGNLRELWWTYRNGAVFAPREYLYQKKATDKERPEMYSTGRCKNLTCAGHQTTCLKGVGIGTRTETCRNWGGPTAMEPCLHQGNVYIKRKLWVWRDQKCIPLVGATIPCSCAGRQTTPPQGSRYRAEDGNLRKLGWTYHNGTVFAPRQY